MFCLKFGADRLGQSLNLTEDQETVTLTWNSAIKLTRSDFFRLTLGLSGINKITVIEI